MGVEASSLYITEILLIKCCISYLINDLQVIKELENAGALFRVLALSATPGSNAKAVMEVNEYWIKNVMLIKHFKSKTDSWNHHLYCFVI